MTPRFPAQRRAAEEFARVVDGPVRADLAGQYAGLARTVTMLRERPQPVPRPEFVGELRDRLMVAADEALAPVAGAAAGDGRRRTNPHRRQVSWRQRHLSAGLAALVMVGGTAGLAAAAQGSLPGDTLYPLKRGIERVEVSMSTNDAAKGKELLDQASTRLSEVQALMKDNDDSSPASVSLIGDTLQDFRTSADKGSELLFRTYQGNSNDSDIADVRAFTTGTMETLQTLADQSPANTTDELSKAGETVADIDQQARVLCVTCSDADPVSLPSSLVNLASAQALETLVSKPAREAHHAAQLAQKADQPAAPDAGAGQPNASPTATPSGPSFGSTDGGGLAGELPTVSKHPIKDLVDGLTAKTPIVNGLGGMLSGVTGPLGTAVEGLTSSLNGLLGKPSSTASPQGSDK